MSLTGRTALVTGGARRVGAALVLGLARAGADVVIHHGHSPAEAETVAAEARLLGRRATVVQADLADPESAAPILAGAAGLGPLDTLVNSASIFEPLGWNDTTLAGWRRHLDVNLTSPFFLCQAFARALPPERRGRIVNVLDWRALRPGADHVPYTVSKAGLAALTRSLAVALAPAVTVNGVALGAVLPPADGASAERLLDDVPAGRLAELDEVVQAVVFLLAGPEYVTGEIIHVDGGRHLV